MTSARYSSPRRAARSSRPYWSKGPSSAASISKGAALSQRESAPRASLALVRSASHAPLSSGASKPVKRMRRSPIARVSPSMTHPEARVADPQIGNWRVTSCHSPSTSPACLIAQLPPRNAINSSAQLQRFHHRRQRRLRCQPRSNLACSTSAQSSSGKGAMGLMRSNSSPSGGCPRSGQSRSSVGTWVSGSRSSRSRISVRRPCFWSL